MILGKVIGSIVSTINHPFYDDRKLLVVDKCHPDWTSTGKYVICVDQASAGVGDQVLVLDEGNGARQILEDPTGPVRSVIVGIVDHAYLE